MRFDLAAIAKAGPKRRRKAVVFRDIAPPAVLATNLYQSTYAHVITTIARHADRVVAEYERTLSSMQMDSADDLTSLLERMGEDLSRLVLLLTPSLRDWVLSIEKWQRGKWVGAALAASGVDLSTLLTIGDVQQTLEATIAWNTSLIKDVGAQAQQRISNAVFDGLRNRTPAREVAKSIQEATGMAKRRAVGVASDQLSKVTSSLADERRQQAGIRKWQWKWSHKQNGRAEHIARDGKIYADTAAGAGDDALPPPEDRPGQLPWCGCRSLAVLSFD